MIEVLKQLFSPAIVEAVGLQQQRMDCFSDLTSRVPVRRLISPSNLDRFPEVCHCGRRDVDTIISW